MTTNYKDRLDPALIRPGRVDFQALISFCTPQQIQHLFFNFYPRSSQAEAQNFINRLKEFKLDSKLSPAVIQGHFLMYKNSPEQAIANAEQIRALLPSISSKNSSTKVKTS